MLKRLNPDHVNNIPFWIFLYQEGLSHKNIADRCNLPRSTIYNYLKHFDIIKKDNMSILKRGSNNPMWAGNKVTIVALHTWVRRNKPRVNVCEMCRHNPPFDLANISNSFNEKTYNRLFSNWQWLCRSCHMRKDGRINNLRQYENKKSIPL